MDKHINNILTSINDKVKIRKVKRIYDGSDNIKVSVIVTTYNNSNTIIKSLDSILNQSYSNMEIIVVNDGSSDNTSNIVNELSKEFSCIYLINLAINSGHMSALSAGFKHASGDWIATVDADGQDNPMLILKMYLQTVSSNADICYTKRKNRNSIINY